MRRPRGVFFNLEQYFRHGVYLKQWVLITTHTHIGDSQEAKRKCITHTQTVFLSWHTQTSLVAPAHPERPFGTLKNENVCVCVCFSSVTCLGRTPWPHPKRGAWPTPSSLALPFCFWPWSKTYRWRDIMRQCSLFTSPNCCIFCSTLHLGYSNQHRSCTSSQTKGRPRAKNNPSTIWKLNRFPQN